MKKAMSLLTATAMAATLLAGCGGGAASSSAAPAADSTSTEASSTAAEPAADAAAEEGKVLNIWCWNDEFQSRFNDYYPGVKEIAADKSTTTLNNGVTVKWTINPNDNNNYQNKLDEALLKQDSAAADDKIDIFLIEADYALKYVDSEYTLDVKKDVGLTDDDLKDQYQYTKDIVTVDGVQKGTTWQATPGLFAYRRSIAEDVLGTDDPTEVQAALSDWDKFNDVAEKAAAKGYKMLSGYDDSYRHVQLFLDVAAEEVGQGTRAAHRFGRALCPLRETVFLRERGGYSGHVKNSEIGTMGICRFLVSVLYAVVGAPFHIGLSAAQPNFA